MKLDMNKKGILEFLWSIDFEPSLRDSESIYSYMYAIINEFNSDIVLDLLEDGSMLASIYMYTNTENKKWYPIIFDTLLQLPPKHSITN